MLKMSTELILATTNPGIIVAESKVIITLIMKVNKTKLKKLTGSDNQNKKGFMVIVTIPQIIAAASAAIKLVISTPERTYALTKIVRALKNHRTSTTICLSYN